MRLSLKAKITLLITVVSVTTSATVSFILISDHKRSMERELINRGITMSEALSRAVAEGLASENLQLIQQVQSIVHTSDVKLAQVYSTVWLPVDAYPLEKFNEPPYQAAIEYFKTGKESFYRTNINLVDVYSPVFYHQFEQVKERKYLIGYVRLMMTTEGVQQTIRKMLMMNILASVLLTLIAVIVLNAFIRKYFLIPLLTLRESISKYRDGSLPDVIPVDSNDEIGELSQEFNRMSIAVKEREEKFRTLFNESPDAILLVDPYGKIIDVNDVAVERYKYRRSDFIGMSATQLYSPEDADNAPARTEMLKERGIAVFEARHMTKDSLVIPTEVNARSVVIGGAAFIISTCRDITERKKAQDALAEEKERLAVTLRSIADGVIVTNTEGTVTLMNRVAEELTGWHGEEGLAKPLSMVFHIINEGTRLPCENPVDKVLSKGFIVGPANHTLLIRRDGTEIIIADSAAPIRDRDSNIIGVVLVFRDITNQTRMETEIRKIQKLESLGVLAGGLAHDFNNLLTGIMGNISIIKLHVDPENKDYARLSAAEKAVERATDLTQQLLTFAKGGAPIKKTLPIADLVRESVDFALSGSNVSCNYSMSGGLWNTEADRGQMAQVFNNLSINAMQAMPDGGIVNVSMENVTLDVNNATTLPAGDYIKIVFSDAGTGIPEEHLSKIFDPYFTTKKRGSGLGLATAFSIVSKHGGHITVNTGPGIGATFSIYLPASKDGCCREGDIRTFISTGHGRVLIMDDEAIIRDVAGQILNSLGYEAGFAEDGAKALEEYARAKAEQRPYSVVIMDLTIPGGMGGKEAVKKLLDTDPNAKVIVSSGYSTDPIMADYRKYGFKSVITKPYNVVRMSEVISRLI
jgi:PAS domain S-box-containing protein